MPPENKKPENAPKPQQKPEIVIPNDGWEKKASVDESLRPMVVDVQTPPVKPPKTEE